MTMSDAIWVTPVDANSTDHPLDVVTHHITETVITSQEKSRWNKYSKPVITDKIYDGNDDLISRCRLTRSDHDLKYPDLLQKCDGSHRV